MKITTLPAGIHSMSVGEEADGPEFRVVFTQDDVGRALCRRFAVFYGRADLLIGTADVAATLAESGGLATSERLAMRETIVELERLLAVERANNFAWKARVEAAEAMMARVGA